MLILSGSYGYPKCDWQIFSVCGFASGSNSKCARFFPKRFTLGTGGVDFFMQELSSEDFFWLFLPVNLLCKTVEHLALFRTSGVLLLSVWPKSSFFSYFFQVGALSLSFERVWGLSYWSFLVFWVKFLVAGYF